MMSPCSSNSSTDDPRWLPSWYRMAGWGTVTAAPVLEVPLQDRQVRHAQHRRAGLLVIGLPDPPGGAEAVFAERRVPEQRVVLGDQHVGMTVAVQVHEAQVGVVPVHVRQRPEG